MKYAARVPLRIDFGGGWTDVPQFALSQDGGGAVLNAAIRLYARGYIIRPGTTPSIMTRLAGQDRNVVRYELTAPSGAGLGASAAQTLLWLTLVKTTIANVSERRELAERAWRVENELGILGGKQDQYASAVGGINFMTFGAQTEVEQLRPDLTFIDQLERRLVLVYTGGKRFSGQIHEGVWARFEAGESLVIETLSHLRRIAFELREAFVAQDLDRFGELMSENWRYQKDLHPSVTNDHLEGLVSIALASGAVGVKATGAGGGGCLLCLSEDGAQVGLSRALTDAGVRRLPLEFDWYGVHLTKG